MQVISIQSQVVHGHVGNSAAVFPLQVRGIDVAAVPTALLSNHPHYPTMRGRVLDAALIADLLRGVEERGLVESSSILLTGYLGSVEIAHAVAAFVERASARNPRLRYICDPVMGDDDLGLFVDAGLIDIFRDRLVPLASIITPNQYELELLTRSKARSAEMVGEAAHFIQARGTGHVIATGCVLDDSAPGVIETVLAMPPVLHRTAIARLPIRPHGTGDLFTALLAASLCEGAALEAACERATKEILAVLQRTHDAEAKEMRLIEALAPDLTEAAVPSCAEPEANREESGY